MPRNKTNKTNDLNVSLLSGVVQSVHPLQEGFDVQSFKLLVGDDVLHCRVYVDLLQKSEARLEVGERLFFMGSLFSQQPPKVGMYLLVSKFYDYGK